MYRYDLVEKFCHRSLVKTLASIRKRKVRPYPCNYYFVANWKATGDFAGRDGFAVRTFFNTETKHPMRIRNRIGTGGNKWLWRGEISFKIDICSFQRNTVCDTRYGVTEGMRVLERSTSIIYQKNTAPDIRIVSNNHVKVFTSRINPWWPWVLCIKLIYD